MTSHRHWTKLFVRLLLALAILVAWLGPGAASAAPDDGTCGQFFYVSAGLDDWPVFLASDSLEPWFIDPFIFDVFEEDAYVSFYEPSFLAGDWGPMGPYANARWLAGYADAEIVAVCPPVDSVDNIAYAAKSDGAAGIYLMNSAGGDLRNIASINGQSLGGLFGMECPTWSPDASEVAFYNITSTDLGDIYIVASDASSMRNSTNSVGWYANPDWSPDGSTFAYEIAFFPLSLVPVDSSVSTWVRDGVNLDEHDPDWSPAGERLAFAEARWDKDATSPPFDLFTIRPDGSDVEMLTDNAYRDIGPAWSPDGSQIAFASNRDGDYEIFVMHADGTHVVQLTINAATDVHPTWSADGSRIAFVSDRDGNQRDLRDDGRRFRRAQSQPQPVGRILPRLELGRGCEPAHLPAHVLGGVSRRSVRTAVQAVALRGQLPVRDRGGTAPGRLNHTRNRRQAWRRRRGTHEGAPRRLPGDRRLGACPLPRTRARTRRDFRDILAMYPPTCGSLRSVRPYSSSTLRGPTAGPTRMDGRSSCLEGW